MLIFAASVFARDCSLNPRDGPRAIESDPLVSDKGIRALHMVECGCMGFSSVALVPWAMRGYSFGSFRLRPRMVPRGC